MGRTGFRCSDIACGSGDLTDAALGAAILDAGINYIDTAENYRRGHVERTIGEAIRNRDRKKIFISTKLGLFGDLSKQVLKDRALKCLERLNTEYIDCLMIHMPSSVEQLKTEGFHAAVAELKAEGRVRFAGLSNHGSQWRNEPEPMEKIHLAAAEDGRFDVALFVYNFLQNEESERILRVYKQKNIGATIMKSNPVLNYLEMKEILDRTIESGKDVPEGARSLVERLKERADLSENFKTKYNLTDFDAIRDAAIKFVLDNPEVSCVCPTIKNYADIDFYVGLSGKRFDIKAQTALAAYQAIFGGFYCRHGCGRCESQCPARVPVNTIMRYTHYLLGQRREKTAMLKYVALPGRRAGACMKCAGFCESACPYGVPVQGLLVAAHQTLTGL